MSYAQTLTPVSVAVTAPPLRSLREEAATSSPAPDSTPQAVIPNPALRLDAQLGLVVLEFRDETGRVEQSLPTKRELDAYRAAGRVTEKTPWLQDPLAPQQPADAMDGKGQLVPLGTRSPAVEDGKPAAAAPATVPAASPGPAPAPAAPAPAPSAPAPSAPAPAARSAEA